MNQVCAQVKPLKPWATLVAILLIALILRLGRLTFQPLWADEGYSVYFASLNLATLTSATAADIHPPFYYYLLKLWMLVFGPGAASLRLLSVGLGVATVAALYALAHRLVAQRVATLAALLLALSPFHIYYAQEVRMYALVGLLAVLSTLFMVNLLNRVANGKPARLCYLLYVVTTTLALYTLYYAAFLPIAQTVFVLITYRRQGRLLVRWLILELMTGLVYLPWIVYAFQALATYVGGKVVVEKYAPLHPLSFFGQVFAALAMGIPSAGRWWLSLGALPVLALVLVAVFHAVRLPAFSSSGQRSAGTMSSSTGLLVLLSVVPVVLGYIVNLFWPFNPIGFQRLFLYCLPFLAVLVALGLDWLVTEARQTAMVHRARPTAQSAALSILVVACAAFVFMMLADFYLSPRYARHDYRPLVHDMARLANPDDVVVALYPWQIGFVRSYFVGALPHLLFVDHAAVWADHPEVMRQELNQLGQTYGRLWFPSYEGAGGILEHAVTTYLTETAYPGMAQWYGDHRLALYVWGSVGQLQSINVSAGEALVLNAVRVSMEPLEAGHDGLRIDLVWQATAALPGKAQVALRLVDDNRRTWARRDSIPENGALPFDTWPIGAVVNDHHALPIPATTPPGSYRLLLGVFDPDGGRNLPLNDANGQPVGSEIEIGKAVVTRGSYHPPLEALGVGHRTAVSFRGAPRLVGYELPTTPLQPGHTVDLDLYWQAEAAMQEDPMLFVQVRDRANKVWGLYEGPAVAPQYPPSRWLPGSILRGQVSFLLAADAPGGDYRLVVGWLRGVSKERIPVVGGGNETLIANLPVVARLHSMILPHPERAMDVRLADEVQFLGYDGTGAEAIPGEALTLTFYWRAMGRIDASYKVFVHLVDEQGRIWAQQDSEPGGGSLPTTSWLPGEVITDTYRLSVPGSIAGGQYTLQAGMYDKATGKRLRAATANGQSIGDSIELERLIITPR